MLIQSFFRKAAQDLQSLTRIKLSQLSQLCDILTVCQEGFSEAVRKTIPRTES